MAAPYSGLAGLGGGIQQLRLVAAAQALQVRRHLLWTQLAHQLAGFVEQTAFSAEQQQLVGVEVDGGAGGDVLAGQVEDLPGGRIPQRREQDDAAFIQLAVDALAVNAPHFAGVVIVDAIDHANRPRGDEVAAGDAQARTLHRRACHVHRQARLDGDAQLANGVDHAFQGRAVGDPQVTVKARCQAVVGQARLDLRTRAMHQHQAHAEAVQQHQVVNDIAEIRVGNALARQHHHKGAVAVGIDIGRSVAEPIDVVVHCLKNLCRIRNAWSGAGAPDEAARSGFIVAVGAASRVLSSG